MYANKKYEGYAALKAEEYLSKAIELSHEIGSKDYEYNSQKSLADLYKQEKRWAEAHEHLEKYHTIKEEVLSDEARKAAEMMEMRRVIAEKEREKELEKQQMELEMKRQQQSLSDKTLQLVQQTEMLQNFRGELEGIVVHADTAETALRSIRTKIKELPENVMNWNRFEDDFRTVHPHFQSKLKERYPKLTAMEVKVCCLLRIGMHSLQIATLLFLSERTVENHRYRLRKKLNLKSGEEISDILSKI